MFSGICVLFHAEEQLAVGRERPGVLAGDGLHVVAGGAESAHDGEHLIVQEEGILLRGLYLLRARQQVLKLGAQVVRGVGELDQTARSAELKLGAAAGKRGLERCGGGGKAARKGADGGQYLSPRHCQGGLALYHHQLAVLLLPHLQPGAQLRVGEDLVPGIDLGVGLVQQVGQCLGRGAQIVQSAALGLLDPGGVVAVAVEDDALVLAHDTLYEGLERTLEVIRRLELVGKLPELLGDRRVYSNVRGGDGRRRAGHAELELVAREGKGRGAVAVRSVLGEARQGVDADLEELLLLDVAGGVVLDGLEYAGELLAEEHRDYRRGRFGRAETVVVARAGYGDAQQVLIVVRGLDDGAEEEQELRVLARGLAGIEKIDARVGGKRPVVVLAGAVDALEGLFAQQADEPVLFGGLLHDVHDELVVVRGDVGRVIYAGELVLGGSGLIVLGPGRDADAPELLVYLAHEGRYAGLDGAEIVVVHLLALGRHGAVEGAAGVDEVLALLIHVALDEEILLLGADHGQNQRCLGAEELEHAQGLTRERLHGAQQRRLLVQRLAAVGAEGGGNVEYAVADKGVACRVPGGVAAGLEGGAQTAGGEARRVRLAVDELLAGELHHDSARTVGLEEAVVLLGCDAGHGLEPVREVCCALLEGPVLHGGGDYLSGIGVQAPAAAHGPLHGGIGVLGQPLAHDRVRKYHSAEYFFNAGQSSSPFSI